MIFLVLIFHFYFFIYIYIELNFKDQSKFLPYLAPLLAIHKKIQSKERPIALVICSKGSFDVKVCSPHGSGRTGNGSPLENEPCCGIFRRNPVINSYKRIPERALIYFSWLGTALSDVCNSLLSIFTPPNESTKLKKKKKETFRREKQYIVYISARWPPDSWSLGSPADTTVVGNPSWQMNVIISIERHNRRRASRVLCRLRESSRLPREILESSLNYEANIGSWFARSREYWWREGQVRERYRCKRDLIKYSLVTSRVSEAALCNDNSSCCHVSPDPTNFFPNVKGNLTKVVWAHAVNSQAELDKALSSGRSIAIRSLSFLRFLVYCTREMKKNDDTLIILACSDIAGIVVNVGIALKLLNAVLISILLFCK